jgi:hypothetical protein
VAAAQEATEQSGEGGKSEASRRKGKKKSMLPSEEILSGVLCGRGFQARWLAGGHGREFGGTWILWLISR